MQRKTTLIKTLLGISVATIGIGVLSTCLTSCSANPNTQQTTNNITLYSHSNVVGYTCSIELRASANFEVDKLSWSTPQNDDFQYNVSGEHNEILLISNNNSDSQTTNLNIKAFTAQYESNQIIIRCLCDPNLRIADVSIDEQNPNYTQTINYDLLNKLQNYLPPSFDFSSFSSIYNNNRLTEEEKYQKFLILAQQQNIKVVDHISLRERIEDIFNEKENYINSLSELSNQQKQEILNSVHEEYAEYVSNVINDSFTTTEFYENTIDYLKTSDEIPSEYKNESVANLELNNFLEEHELNVDLNGLTYNSLKQQYLSPNTRAIPNFDVATTILLSQIITIGEGIYLNFNSISEDFLLGSRIVSFDDENTTIIVQFAMINNEDGTIYNVEEPVEYTFTLNLSENLDQQNMLDWLDSLDFKINENISYDYLTKDSGFEFNHYRDIPKVGTTYSYQHTLDQPQFFSDFTYGHGVNLYGWTITYDIARYDDAIFGTHSLKQLYDLGYITNVRMDLDARSVRDQYVAGRLGWEDELQGWDLSRNQWNTTRKMPMSGNIEWLGIYCGSTYDDAKMFVIDNVASSTFVNFIDDTSQITTSISTNWNIKCNSIWHGGWNTNEHSNMEWNNSGWYTQFNDSENQWASMGINDLHNFNTINEYPNIVFNNVLGNGANCDNEVYQNGASIPLTEISNLLLFGDDEKSYTPSEYSDRYELYIGFDKYEQYSEQTLTGKIDFDIIVKNLLTNRIIRVNGYSGNFRKEITIEMFADKLKYLFAIADLLTENNKEKLNDYEGYVIAYVVVEGAINVALIVLQVIDLFLINSIGIIPIVGQFLIGIFVVELVMICIGLYQTIKLVVDCKDEILRINQLLNQIEDLQTFFQNDIDILDSYSDFTPNYFDNSIQNNDWIEEFFFKLLDTFVACSVWKLDSIIDGLKNIYDIPLTTSQNNLIAKRKGVSISILIIVAIELFSFFMFFIAWQILFSDFSRFSISFSDEQRWSALNSNTNNKYQQFVSLWLEFF